MKKIFISLTALFLGLSLSAQPGAVDVKPANTTVDRLLTMEEAIYLGSAYPRMQWYNWDVETGMVSWAEKGMMYGLDPKTKKTSELGPVGRKPAPNLPKDAKNITPGTEGRLAFTSGKSLYISDSLGNVTAVALSENPEITYGQTVSRNEFGISGGIFWSDSGEKLAFYRKDESAVSTFPLLDITSRTGTLMEIKYPMAGMDSEKISLGIYDLATGSTVWADVDDFGQDRYLTNISWSPDDAHVFIQVLDRTQRHCRLNMYDSEDGAFIRTILTEDNDRYVEPFDPIWFVRGSNTKFIYRTDNRDGFRNLYLCDTEGNVKRLTAVDADVHYVGNNGKEVFYTSAEVSPVENHFFKINIRSGKVTRLTQERGWHAVSLRDDCKYFIDRWSNLVTPGRISLKSTSGAVVSELYTAADPSEDFAWCETVLGTVRSADGKYDNWYRLIKPKDFDPTKKYPVILYVYGGPHSQMVRDTWNAELRAWEMYMAQRGYIVYVQDNRGTENRGAEFEKAIWSECGQAEMADQMEGMKMLMSLPYVDSSRIGVHGWSYGGFMTISLMTNYPEVFKVGVAGGPVIDWKWYEVMYGERYMSTPQDNPEGYAKTSLMNKAGDLKGKLLICQGAIDNTVLWQHSLNFTQACISHNVQVDYFPYPVAEHNVFGRDRIHLMDKVTMYFEDYL